MHASYRRRTGNHEAKRATQVHCCNSPRSRVVHVGKRTAEELEPSTMSYSTMSYEEFQHLPEPPSG